MTTAATDVRARVVAGASAGLVADVVMHPADTLRTHRQSRSSPTSFRSLYRGFPIVAVLSAPSHALYFSCYDAAQGHVSPGAAGAIAEVCGAALFVPCDILKKRAMLAHNGYGSLLEIPRTLRQIVRTEGLRGLYAGYAASVLAWTPFAALYFATFERSRVPIGSITALPQPAVDLTAGMLAGALAGFVTSPLDLIVTRVQTRYRGASSVEAVVLDIVGREGVRPATLFRGAGARVMWLAPAAGITLSVFETLKPRLDSYFARRNELPVPLI